MRTKTTRIALSRRLFVTALTAGTVAGMTGSAVQARGGGGDVVKDRQKRGRRSTPRGVTQKQFLSMSRSDLFRNAKLSDVSIDGFSQEMSVNMFEMAVANLARTRSLVRRLQDIPQTPKRQAALVREMQIAQEEFDGFWGLSSQRQKRKRYYEAVSEWVRNPREGALELRYTG